MVVEGGCGNETSSPYFQGGLVGPSLFVGPNAHLGLFFVGVYFSGVAGLVGASSTNGYLETQLGLRLGLSDFRNLESQETQFQSGPGDW